MNWRCVSWLRVGIKRSWRKMALVGGIAGLVGLAFCWGRSGAQTIAAAPAASAKPGDMVPEAPLAPESGSDYSRRVVAYIHKNIPITREDLGEFLIARYGLDKVEALVNRRIVDMACQARGIQITEAEVNAALAADLRGLGDLTPSDFEKKLLKPRNTTLYQWKEDVIRPKLALTEFCRDRIKVTEEDIQNTFENHYGPKVKCRMILIPKIDGKPDRKRFDLWSRVSPNTPEGNLAFDKASREQPIPTLAASGGDVPPICRHFGDERIEHEAFGLSPGEVSKLLGTPDGDVILKCCERIQADKTRTLDKERAALQKEIFDRKILEEIPKVLKELRAKAEPQFFFKRAETADEVYRAGMQATGLKPEAIRTK
jgi:hypothetical protein